MRNGCRVLPAITAAMMTTVLVRMVAFKVSMESLPWSQRVLRARIVTLQVRCAVVVEMSQRGDGEEKDERANLQRRKNEGKKSTPHGALLSSALLPKST